jgi:hypothetical protein
MEIHVIVVKNPLYIKKLLMKNVTPLVLLMLINSVVLLTETLSIISGPLMMNPPEKLEMIVQLIKKEFVN